MYKTLTINFNLNDPKDNALYEWLQPMRGRGAFIKNHLEEIMNNNSNFANTTNIKPGTDTSTDDLSPDEVSEIRM